MSSSDRLNPELERALERLNQYARESGAEAWDVVAGESSSEGLSLSRSKVDSLELSGDRGIGLRLFREGSPGYAFAERLTDDVLRQVVADAWDHSFLSSPLPIVLPEPAPLPEVELSLFDPAAAELSLGEMESFALELDRRVRAEDATVVEVPHLGIDRSLSSHSFLNSRGVFSHSRRSAVSAGVEVLVKRADSAKTGYRVLTRRNQEALDLELLASESVARAVAMLCAAPVESGHWPLLLDRRISGRLFHLYSSAFFAEQVQKGQSFLAGKRGTTIASPLLTLRDDPHRSDLSGSRLIDSEGVVTRPTALVQEGVLCHWLHNLESAGREGETPTGNGARGYSGSASTAFSNLIVEPGESSVEKMCASHPRLLWIRSLEGASGCSAVSGELSIGAQGFLVERGEIVRPVDGITLSSNWLQLLSSIEAIGGETADPFSSIQVPDLLLPSVKISG